MRVHLDSINPNHEDRVCKENKARNAIDDVTDMYARPCIAAMMHHAQSYVGQAARPITRVFLGLYNPVRFQDGTKKGSSEDGLRIHPFSSWKLSLKLFLESSELETMSLPSCENATE